MATETLQETLVKYLTDAHSIEEQALVQMRAAPKIVTDDELARIFAEHERETEEHERLVRERLDAHGGSPAKVKELVMKAGGAAFAAFAKVNPDSSGKLVFHAYSYEHLELASYELLQRVAARAGDDATVEVARRIAAQERAMGERLAAHFDDAVEASLRETAAHDLRDRVVRYLADAHALEEQAIQLLEGGEKIVGDEHLAAIMRAHLEETRGHERRVRERLEATGEGPNRLKDAALRLGGLNWGGFFAAHPDTPGKLVAFSVAFEHLEIAGYELLARVAERAGDTDTVELAKGIVRDELGAAAKLEGSYDRAVEASLQAQHA